MKEKVTGTETNGNKMSKEEMMVMLNRAEKDGKLDLFEKACEEMEQERRQEILDQAPYKYSQYNDGLWYTYLPKADGGRVKRKRKTKEEIEDVIIEFYESDEGSKPTILEVFTDWNKQRVQDKDIKQGTGDREWDTFNRHFSRIQDVYIGDMTPETWQLFLQEELSGHKLYQRAWANLKALFNGLITYARQHGYIDYYPDDVLKGVAIGRKTFKERVKDDQKDSFSLDERRAIIGFIENKAENRTIHELGILLLFECGLRVGELAALKYEDIDDGRLHVRRTETRHKENGKWVYDVDDRPKTVAGDRRVPIPEDYLWILTEAKRLEPDGEYIFTYHGKRITACGFRKKLYKLCDEVGISHKGPHKARKTYISILFENDVPDYMIERLAGHTNIQTSKDYYLRQIGYHKELEEVNRIPELKKHEA